MKIQTFPVHPALQPYVRVFLSIDGCFPQSPPQAISPKGEAALFFPFRQPSSLFAFPTSKSIFSDSSVGLHKMFLVGQSNTYGLANWEGDTSLIIVPLSTTGFYHFLQESTCSITNSFYSLDYLNLRSSHQELQERLWEVQDASNAQQLIESFLLRHFYKLTYVDNLSSNIQPVTNWINKTSGLIHIDKIADKFRLSTRRLQQLFAQQVGLSPKQYSRVIRFRSLIQKIHQKPQTSLMQIVADFDFTDESHLIRDFKQFLNITPTLYSENKPLFDQFVFKNAFP